MDNLSSHKVPGIKEKIETAGATLLYLPPYSPNLNPIEKAWYKLKHILRKAKARSEELLDQATGEALKLITPEDARGWFRLCATDLSYFAECSLPQRRAKAVSVQVHPMLRLLWAFSPVKTPL